MSKVSEFRAFNRFYTQRIGLLAESLPGGDLPLPQARVLYEVAKASEPLTAADLTRSLEMDKAHVSRIVARLRAEGLIAGKPAPGRRIALSLTPEGRKAFSEMDRASETAIEALLGQTAAGDQNRLAEAFSDIRAALEENPSPITLRALLVGDLGWIAHRQGLLYHREYGWDWTFEALVARILADFVEHFDPDHEAGFVAERNGAVLGSSFLMRSDDPSVAKLRLLYVEPHARGERLGARLVEAVIGRARELGYAAVTLWTNDILVAARRIYLAQGFRLIEEAPHHSFGVDLVGQTWRLDLTNCVSLSHKS